ncbi:MAG: SBBP repeat-containing protein, partial [Bryobacterales bacterium]|nr:SBBP repeat-containing protein [Bryobacterales bacterium]
MKLTLCAALLVSAAGTQPSDDWTISTFAGTWEVGDGGPATAAGLTYPGGVAADGLGNIYIAGSSNNRIRRVDPSGTITTIAGTGERGFGGDGGPATQAQLASPGGVAVDGLGNVYISDMNNHRIRRVDSSGIITTIAGTGERGFGGDGGPATAARLYLPDGVAID